MPAPHSPEPLAPARAAAPPQPPDPTGLRAPSAIQARYAEGSLGRIMEAPAGVHRPETTVAEAIAHLREEVKQRFITYLYVADGQGRLVGLVVMREMLLARPEDRLGELMIQEPFRFAPGTTIAEAMTEAAARQYPVYPICDEEGRLLGLVRGQSIFEQRMFSIVVQAGSMVGVEKEEQVSSTWRRSFRLRHPWLQINLVTAVAAGAVVGLFEDTITQVVALAAFLPVLAGQCSNTGCQALAVTLRGMTLGDIERLSVRQIVGKEALVGLCNGLIIGLVAGVVMYLYALKSSPDQGPLLLGLVVWVAMAGSCVASGVCGAVVPLVMRRMGADPATASSIVVTTGTDVVGMGLLLALAAAFVA